MAWIKNIAMLMLSLSVILAGVPAQAEPECPMAKMMQQMATQNMAKAEPCDHCPKMAQEKQQHKKSSGCCDDAGCNAQCMGAGSLSMNLPTLKTALPIIAGQVAQVYATDAALSSAHLNSQERPPKLLS